MSHKHLVPRQAAAMTRDQSLDRSGSLEQLENRLTIDDFMKMQELFMAPDLNNSTGLTREEFVEKMSALVRRGTKDEYGELFDKINLTREDLIDWNKLTSFVLLELYERDERTKLLVTPQWKDLRRLPLIHKDAVQNITFLKSLSSYLTVSRSGLIGIWGESLKLQRTLQITTDAAKPKNLWVTSLIALPNVNKVAVAFTSKEIYFAEINSKQGFSCQYKLQGLQGTVICMDYWYNPYDGNEAILTLGDVCGQVQAIAFNTALISLFERPSNSPEDENVTTIIKWQELVSGCHKCCYTFRHKLHGEEWVRQVAYSSSLDVFMSVTTSSTNSLVLAWREKLSRHLTTTTFHIAQGVNAFDFHSRLNLIATAGINRRVCLWNPYVTSKYVGVLEGHLDSITAVRFITERKLLFSFAKDKVLRIWDIQHQLCIHRISGSFPKTLDFQSVLYFDESHGHLFISFNNQLTLLEMELDLGKNKVSSHRRAVTCILYSSMFKQVISSDAGSTVIFWLLETGQKIKEFTGCHGSAEISAMSLDGTETRLFTGSTDGTVKVWDFNGHCHHKLNAGRNRTVEISQILVLPRTVLVFGWDSWNVDNWNVDSSFSSACLSDIEHWSEDAGTPTHRMITVFRFSSLTQFSVQPSEWKGGVQHQDDILCAAFLPPQTLVTGSSGGEIVVWNNSTESVRVRLWLKPGSPHISNSGAAIQQKGTPTGRLCSRRCTLSVADHASFDTENFNAITRLFFLESRKNTLVTGGANLVSCGAAGYVRFWNIQRSKLLAEFEAHSGMGSIIMTVDRRNQYLITGDPAGWVKTWNIEEYCLTLSENTTSQLPPLIRLFQPHDNGITDLETCMQNNNLFILSSSIDCSIVLSDIYGVLLGIFGQEGHWRIANYIPPSFVRGENKHQMKENDIKINPMPFVDEDALSIPEERAIPVAGDKEDWADVVNIWDNTILGRKYKEKIKKKGRKYVLSDKAAGIKPSVVFRSLNIETLTEMPEMNKLNFLLAPDNYFGEKSAEKSSEDLKLPTLSATLKGAFNEKNLFPKEILDREKKSRKLLEEICNKGQIKNKRKPGKLKEK